MITPSLNPQLEKKPLATPFEIKPRVNVTYKVSKSALVGALPGIIRHPLQYLQECSQNYGDIVNFGNKIYILNHPDFIEQALVETNRRFIKGINKSGPEKAPTLAGNGLVVSEGSYWLRQRRLSQPAFHRQRLEGYAGEMVNETYKMLENWEVGQKRELESEIMRLTLAIVAKTLFNTSMEREAEKVEAVLEPVMSLFSNPLMLLPIPSRKKRRAKRDLAELDRYLYSLIEEKQVSGEDSGDLLSMLISARDEDGSRMSPKQIRDELITFVIAGHETTSLSLIWAFYLLYKNPEVEEKVVEELKRVAPNRALAVKDLADLAFTGAVIKETMRLYPPVWGMSREVTAPAEVGGIQLKKGARLILPQWVLHRDSRYFPEPSRFFPERWLDGLEKRLPRFAYFPFGGGPRVCIGNHFAMAEATLILGAILKRFHLEILPGTELKPKPSITLRPSGKLNITLQSRG